MLQPVKAGLIPVCCSSLSLVLLKSKSPFVRMTDNTLKPRLLIVDDEAEVRGVLNDLLCDTYDCTEVSSAEEAVDNLRTHDYQLVISDITMSGMSGLEMIPHVKAISPETVIVMISGMQTIESAINALRLGAFDYLMKPFDLRQAEAAVSRALNHYDLIVSKRLYETQLEELVAQRTAELDEALGSLENAYRSTLKALTAALEARDAETHGHSERVVTFSLRLGREYGLNAQEMKALEFGSLLHDIGKIGVPDAILLKPDKLNPAERQIMRTHTTVGAELLSKSNIPHMQMAEEIARAHHEWWDGSGYPGNLSGGAIPLAARITALADVYDALTHKRPYKEAWPIGAALEEIASLKGKQFDPQLTDHFLVLIHKLQEKHADIDKFLGQAAQASPFLVARSKIWDTLQRSKHSDGTGSDSRLDLQR